MVQSSDRGFGGSQKQSAYLLGQSRSITAQHNIVSNKTPIIYQMPHFILLVEKKQIYYAQIMNWDVRLIKLKHNCIFNFGIAS